MAPFGSLSLGENLDFLRKKSISYTPVGKWYSLD